MAKGIVLGALVFVLIFIPIIFGTPFAEIVLNRFGTNVGYIGTSLVSLAFKTNIWGFLSLMKEFG